MSASAVRSRSNGSGRSENSRSDRFGGGGGEGGWPPIAGGAAAGGAPSIAASTASTSMRFDRSTATRDCRAPRPMDTSPVTSPSGLVKVRPCRAAPLRKPPAASVRVPWKATVFSAGRGRRASGDNAARSAICAARARLAPVSARASASVPLAAIVDPAAWKSHVHRERSRRGDRHQRRQRAGGRGERQRRAAETAGRIDLRRLVRRGGGDVQFIQCQTRHLRAQVGRAGVDGQAGDIRPRARLCRRPWRRS